MWWFRMYLANLSDLAAKVRLPETAPNLELALRNSSDRFRGEVGYPVHRVTNDVVFLNGHGTDTLVLPARPVDVHSVEVDGLVLSAAQREFSVDRAGGVIRARGAVFPDDLGNVKVIYSHGWEVIPGDIADAVLEHAATLARVLAHLQQNSAGSTQESYGQAAMVGVTQKWADTVARYSRTGEQS